MALGSYSFRGCDRSLLVDVRSTSNGLGIGIADSESGRGFQRAVAWFVFKENFDRRIALSMALIVAGGVVLSASAVFHIDGLVGPFAIAGACLAWAIDNNFTRKVSINDAMSIACLKRLVAGPLSITLALRYGAEVPPLSMILRAGLLGFVGYGLSLIYLLLHCEISGLPERAPISLWRPLLVPRWR
jgi:hypothetical protein